MSRRCLGHFLAFLCCCIVGWTSALPAFLSDAAGSDRKPRIQTGNHFVSNSEIEAELQVIKHRILADLGLTRIPDMSRVNTSAEEMQRMLHVYRRSVEDSEEEEEKEADHAVHRFYSYTALSSKTAQRRTRSVEGPQTLLFNVDIVGSHGNRTTGLSLQSAKLRVLKRTRPTGAQDSSNSFPAKPSMTGISEQTTATVLLYQITESPNYGDNSRLLVEQRNVPLDSERWEVFDVSRTVSKWLEDPSQNHGFQLECSGCGHLFVTSRDFESQHNVSSATRLGSDLKPTLDILISESPSRTKRSRPQRREKSENASLDCSAGMKSKRCCRHTLRVSFSEIGWDWIVQPLEFEAYFCKGKCPLRYANYASTHAVIQNILNHDKRKQIPRPCCAPKMLKKLPLLHYNDKDPPELVVTHKKGMIVKECACS